MSFNKHLKMKSWWTICYW